MIDLLSMSECCDSHSSERRLQLSAIPTATEIANIEFDLRLMV
jgi:hypothetical protein